MIDFEKIEKEYDDLISYISDVEVLPKEAQRLATKFFRASYEVNKIRRQVKSEVILLEGVLTSMFPGVLKRAVGGGITEKKSNAQGDIEYQKIVRECEEMKNTYDYFRHLYDILTNGHIFYKNLIRE